MSNGHRAMIKIKETKHPISEEVIGYRLQATVENMAGNFRGMPIPSFRKPYFICEGSDLPSITKRDLAKFLDNVRWNGYDAFIPLGTVGDMMD